MPPLGFFLSLTVSHPIHMVWGFLADFGHAPLWDPGTLRADVVRDGSIKSVKGTVGVDVVWSVRSRLAGRASTGRYQLCRGHPHWITLTGRHPGLTRTIEFALVDLDGHTEVHLTMVYHFHGLTAPARLRWQRHALFELTRRAAADLPAVLDSHLSNHGSPPT